MATIELMGFETIEYRTVITVTAELIAEAAENGFVKGDDYETDAEAVAEYLLDSECASDVYDELFAPVNTEHVAESRITEATPDEY